MRNYRFFVSFSTGPSPGLPPSPKRPFPNFFFFPPVISVTLDRDALQLLRMFFVLPRSSASRVLDPPPPFAVSPLSALQLVLLQGGFLSEAFRRRFWFFPPRQLDRGSFPLPARWRLRIAFAISYRNEPTRDLFEKRKYSWSWIPPSLSCICVPPCLFSPPLPGEVHPL